MTFLDTLSNSFSKSINPVYILFPLTMKFLNLLSKNKAYHGSTGYNSKLILDDTYSDLKSMLYHSFLEFSRTIDPCGRALPWTLCIAGALEHRACSSSRVLP